MVLFTCLAFLCVKKPFQILLIDVIQIAVIDCLVRSLTFKALCGFKLLFKLLCVSVHFDLSEDELCEFLLNVKGQVVILAAHHVWSLCGLGPQSTVGTGQDDLHEVRVVESAIQVRVEELDKVVAVSFGHIARQTVVSDVI